MKISHFIKNFSRLTYWFGLALPSVCPLDKGFLRNNGASWFSDVPVNKSTPKVCWHSIFTHRCRTKKRFIATKGETESWRILKNSVVHHRAVTCVYQRQGIVRKGNSFEMTEGTWTLIWLFFLSKWYYTKVWLFIDNSCKKKPPKKHTKKANPVRQAICENVLWICKLTSSDEKFW